MPAPNTVAMGIVTKGDQWKILIQKALRCSPCPNEQGTAEADQAHVLGKEIKADGEESIDPCRAETSASTYSRTRGSRRSPRIRVVLGARR